MAHHMPCQMGRLFERLSTSCALVSWPILKVRKLVPLDVSQILELERANVTAEPTPILFVHDHM